MSLRKEWSRAWYSTWYLLSGMNHEQLSAVHFILLYVWPSPSKVLEHQGRRHSRHFCVRSKNTRSVIRASVSKHFLSKHQKENELDLPLWSFRRRPLYCMSTWMLNKQTNNLISASRVARVCIFIYIYAICQTSLFRICFFTRVQIDQRKVAIWSEVADHFGPV